jgi:hypothetical protein
VSTAYQSAALCLQYVFLQLGLTGAACAALFLPAAVNPGGLLINLLAPLPLGTIVILPGLVLSPFLAPLTMHQSNGIMPYSFGGNCNLLGKPVQNILGNTPANILALIPQKACLPPGWLYNIGNLSASGFPGFSASLPRGTVILNNDTLYVPSGMSEKHAEAFEGLPGFNETVWTGTNDTGESSKHNQGFMFRPFLLLSVTSAPLEMRRN